ncbi:MAG: hypothetical protein IAE79_09650 [Anaerolinea sp.]|nr:hypothetical protein [Anaerolinea sp.]
MTTINVLEGTSLDRGQWVRIGVVTAVASIIAVLIVQAVAIAIWPDIALFKPLDSYPRTALFTLIPAVGATALLAWLSRRKPDPVPTFLKISAVVLVLSIIPDYLLPVAYKSFLASSVTAFMHVVAAAVTVSVLVISYRRQSGA